VQRCWRCRGAEMEVLDAVMSCRGANIMEVQSRGDAEVLKRCRDGVEVVKWCRGGEVVHLLMLSCQRGEEGGGGAEVLKRCCRGRIWR